MKPRTIGVGITDAQLCLLRCISRFANDGAGWAEVELQYLCERTTEALPSRLEASVCKRVGDALRRKHLIDADGAPLLTEVGKAVLSQLECAAKGVAR